MIPAKEFEGELWIKAADFHKQKKEWVGLTEADKKGIFDACEPDERSYVIAMTEALLKEKNNG